MYLFSKNSTYDVQYIVNYMFGDNIDKFMCGVKLLFRFCKMFLRFLPSINRLEFLG